MLQTPPAVPGMPEDEIDTPALVLDLDAFEHNLDKMAALLAPTGVRLRAHAKTHKCPVIAHQQIARGAVGQCVQKVSEAEVLAWSGVPDILLSNEVVGAAKLARFAALARIAKVAICADAPAQVDAIERAAVAAGVRLTVLVELAAGRSRCGVDPGPPLLELARRVAASRHLRFGGLQAYHGGAQHLRTEEARRAALATTLDEVRETKEALRRVHGLDCPLVTGAGTGTFLIEAHSGIYNEVQAGSYAFMDADYRRNRDASGEFVSTFQQSLFVLATVMSAPRPGVLVVDAGHKAIPVESGLPPIHNRPDLAYTDASCEHGKIDYDPGKLIAAAPALGEKIRLVPSHCDPTVDRYDWYVGVRGGRVECLWPVAARGAMS